MSPDGQLLLSIDETGRALLIARQRGVLLHHFSFKGPVSAAQFSPDGKYVAVAVGKLLQVSRTCRCSHQQTRHRSLQRNWRHPSNRHSRSLMVEEGIGLFSHVKTITKSYCPAVNQRYLTFVSRLRTACDILTAVVHGAAVVTPQVKLTHVGCLTDSASILLGGVCLNACADRCGMLLALTSC